MIFPNHTYDIIYADPPWMERGGGKIKRGADRHYPLMSTRDICDLPVREISADNAHLYLWVTNNFLSDGFRVMETWGYRYVTCITWIKGTTHQGKTRLQVGLGQYFRGCTEHCLFGVRGHLPYRIDDAGKRAQGTTGFIALRTKHSEKPDEMRRMIERVSGFPGCRKIELFAREQQDEWECWGNDLEGLKKSAREWAMREEQ